MDPIAIASLIVGIVALYFAWLQIDYRFKKKKQTVGAEVVIDVLQEILEKKVINVGCFNYPPFVNYSEDSNEQPTGYYPTIFKLIAQKHGLTINWKYISICNSVEAILSKEADLIISVFQTPKRARLVDFCCLSHSIKIGGVAKQSLEGITSLADLVTSKLKIVVGKNEIGHELITVYEIPKSHLIIIENEDISKIVSFVEVGQADIAVLDSVSVKNFFEKHFVRKDGTLKAIFQSNPLHMCLNGIMIQQEQHKLAKWLQTEVGYQRINEDVSAIERGFLSEYNNIIGRL